MREKYRIMIYILALVTIIIIGALSQVRLGANNPIQETVEEIIEKEIGIDK